MRTTTVSFPKNIYHYCQRNFADRDLLNVKISDENRRLGALPYDWLKNRRPKKYAKITEKVDTLFREFAVLNGSPSHLEEYEKKLSKILKRKDVKFDYVDCGSYKYCHKITVGDFSYALLSFVREFWPDKQLEYDTLCGSGALVEPCRIFNFYKEYSHGRVAKPFMTRFVNDTKADKFDGYMLMKFIDENDKSRAKGDLPTFQQEFYKYKMVDCNQGNIINGIIADIGKIEENGGYIKSSEFRQNLFNFLGIIEQNHKENFTTSAYKKYGDNAEENWKANHNAEEFIYSLMEKGIDIYNIDIREHIKKLDELEQKYAIKKIRKLKKAHNLKLKLHQKEEYEKYKQYVEKYVNKYGSWSLRAELLM